MSLLTVGLYQKYRFYLKIKTNYFYDPLHFPALWVQSIKLSHTAPATHPYISKHAKLLREHPQEPLIQHRYILTQVRKLLWTGFFFYWIIPQRPNTLSKLQAHSLPEILQLSNCKVKDNCLKSVCQSECSAFFWRNKKSIWICHQLFIMHGLPRRVTWAPGMLDNGILF